MDVLCCQLHPRMHEYFYISTIYNGFLLFQDIAVRTGREHALQQSFPSHLWILSTVPLLKLQAKGLDLCFALILQFLFCRFASIRIRMRIKKYYQKVVLPPVRHFLCSLRRLSHAVKQFVNVIAKL